jgi:ATP-binding cassette subfamily B protein
MYDNTLISQSYKLVPEIKNPLIRSSFIAIIATVIRMLCPVFIALGIDLGVMQSKYDIVLEQSVYFFVAVILLYFVQSKALLAIGLVGETYVKKVRQRLFRHLSSLDMDYFEKNKTGVLVARMTSDMESLQAFANEGAGSILTSVLTIIGATIAVFLVDVNLSLIAFVSLPLLGIATRIFRKYADEAYWTVREWIGQVLASLQEGISGVRIIKAYAGEKAQYEKFNKVNREHYKANMKSARNIAIYFPFIEITRVTSICCVLWFGAIRITQGNLTVGELVALLLYLNYFFDPFIQLSFTYDLLRSAGSSIKKVYSILDTSPELSLQGDIFPEQNSNEIIRFDNVNFSYGRETVLHDVSFTITQGEKVAIVGETGAGKSTIAKIILRFYLPNEGRVEYFGVDAGLVAQKWVRDNIAYVPQESFLFRGSIRDNLLYSDPQSLDLERALNDINMGSWFKRYEEGLDHEVGERGGNISSGERQFVALLRAVISKKPIIVFDEATSNLDMESESAILKATDNLLSYQTSLVIAHRLETVLTAERIIVMDQGKLVGFGTHEELLSNNIVYKELFSAWSLVG